MMVISNLLLRISEPALALTVTDDFVDLSRRVSDGSYRQCSKKGPTDVQKLLGKLACHTKRR